MTAEYCDDGTRRQGRVKCLVWDLDHTLWNGVLSEGDSIAVSPNVRQILDELDRRGILLSIASKNDSEPALDMLDALGLRHYFLFPQISWSPKSQAIDRIAQSFNISKDALAFIDDQSFERDEVAYHHPEVLCIDASQLDELVGMPALMPKFVTDESARRRLMYQEDAVRQKVEDTFPGPKAEFLASLDMVFTIDRADVRDLQRLAELTARTNQLNTTGRIYSSDELDDFRRSADHILLVAALKDKYGAYGKIGLGLLEVTPQLWNIKLLLMSCRVMSRGVGNVLLGHIIQAAKARGVALRSEMISNDRNRLMYATYRFAGFREVCRRNGVEILECDFGQDVPMPGYVTIDSDTDALFDGRSASTATDPRTPIRC